MTLIKGNISNGKAETIELKKRIAEAEQSDKENEMHTFQETVNNLSDSIEECTDTLKILIEKYKNPEPQEYFDKEGNKNIAASIEKAIGLIQKFKQSSIDFSPINSIASEIKRGNDNILSVVSNLPKQSNYEAIIKQISLMVENSNQAISNLKQQVDITPMLEKINTSIENNRPSAWEFNSKRTPRAGEIVTTATPIYKK